MIREPKRLDLSLYIRREPVILAVLTGVAVVSFLAVTGLARLYQAQEQALAVEWSTRGLDDLNAGRYKAAIPEFHTALEYARDNDDYRLDLAEALVGLNRIDEAYAYLINVRDQQPDNGVVNLELARVAVQRKQADQALRFYHNAINATWPENQEKERRKARLELIDYLLRINARTQAESELIALEANVGEDAAQQEYLGELLLRVEDYARALAAFRESLKLTPNNAAAEAGAGFAAFNEGMYPAAERYLQEAVAATPDDTASAALLRTTDSILRLDPYRPRISTAERDRTVMEGFAASGERLKSCGVLDNVKAPAEQKPAAGTPRAILEGLAEQWTKLKPQVTERGLREDPDLANTTMNLAFQIESQKSAGCGAATEDDKALALIANLHEEN
jgi:tetratricopeptide (TPR) repeat protein